MFGELFWMAAADAAQSASEAKTENYGLYYFICIIVLIWSIPKVKREKQAKRIFYHLAGLQLPVHAPCWLEFQGNKLVFQAVGHQFDLDMTRITDISLQAFSQTQTQAFPSYWHYSIPREIDVETTTPCLTIIYTSGNEVKSIILDASKARKEARRIVRKSSKRYSHRVYHSNI